MASTSTTRRPRLLWLPSSTSTTSISRNTSTSCCEYTSLENDTGKDNENVTSSFHRYSKSLSYRRRRKTVALVVSQSESNHQRNHNIRQQPKPFLSTNTCKLANDIEDCDIGNKSKNSISDSMLPVDVPTTLGWLTRYCSDDENDHQIVNTLEIIGGNENDDDDDDEDDEPSYTSNNSYVAKYYGSNKKGKLVYPKLRKPYPYNKHHALKKKNSKDASSICDHIHLLNQQKRKQLYYISDIDYDNNNSNEEKIGLSQSFETQETIQLEEEASETSICTITDDEESLSRIQQTDDTCCSSTSSITIDGSSHSPKSLLLRKWIPKRKVQWIDEVYPDRNIITNVYDVHYNDEPSYTCRVVFLLLMDHTSSSESLSMNNYEFLHCEFRQDDRLRICDALPQITRLVLGPKSNNSNTHPSEQSVGLNEPFRPFTRLYLDGKELINTLALQDYCLEDGQSTLVALREPLPPTVPSTITTNTGDNTSSSVSIASNTAEEIKKHRNELLRQASLLLADKCLRRGIRKARIAGRSLQTLYGPIGLREEEERLARLTVESENDLDEVNNVTSCNSDDVVNTMAKNHQDSDSINDFHNPSWTVFDHLTRTSFDEEDDSEWATSGDTNTFTFDVNFFEGTNFFRCNSYNN